MTNQAIFFLREIIIKVIAVIWPFSFHCIYVFSLKKFLEFFKISSFFPLFFSKKFRNFNEIYNDSRKSFFTRSRFVLQKMKIGANSFFTRIINDSRRFLIFPADTYMRFVRQKAIWGRIGFAVSSAVSRISVFVISLFPSKDGNRICQQFGLSWIFILH